MATKVDNVCPCRSLVVFVASPIRISKGMESGSVVGVEVDTFVLCAAEISEYSFDCCPMFCRGPVHEL